MKPTMFLCEAKKGKNVYHKLVSTHELKLGKKANRGITIVKSGKWGREEQEALADKYILCKKWIGPEVHRICGRRIRPRSDGHRRQFCGSCVERVVETKLKLSDINVFARKGQQVLFETTDKRTSPLIMKFNDCAKERICELEEENEILRMKLKGYCDMKDRLQELETQLQEKRQEIRDLTAKLDDGPKMCEILDVVYPLKNAEFNCARGTYNNAKCKLKAICAEMGLTLNSRRNEFLKTLTTPEEMYKMCMSMNDSVNTLKTARKIMRHFGSEPWARTMTDLEKANAPKRLSYQNPICSEQEIRINTIIDFFEIDRKAVYPGKLLLNKIQDKLIEYEPTTIDEHIWICHRLLGFFMPGGRDSVKHLKWTSQIPKTAAQYEENANNLILYNRDSSRVEGIYFGGLKKCTTDKYKHLWNKRYTLVQEGMQQADRVMEMNHIDYGVFYKKLTLSLEHLWRTNGGKFGKKMLCNQKQDNIEFFGIARVGSQVERLIFRNGYPREMDLNFVTYVMQHRLEVDQESYVKDRLMIGPWGK
jgi:hypothetical protein